MQETKTLPVLPLRDIVVFPHMVVPLFVGRDKSVRALEEVMKNDKQILLATQKNSSDDDPAPSAIFDIGVVATVSRTFWPFLNVTMPVKLTSEPVSSTRRIRSAFSPKQ